MPRKKKNTIFVGFNCNVEDVQWMKIQADERELDTSHIIREAIKTYRAIHQGSATLVYNTPVTSVQAEPVAEAIGQATETPEADTVILSEST